jgi:hypothetical protein
VRRFGLLAAGVAVIVLTGCGSSHPRSSANGATSGPPPTAGANAGPSASGIGPTPDAKDGAGPAHDDRNRLCGPIDPAFLASVSGPGFNWGPPKIKEPTVQSGLSCQSSNTDKLPRTQTLTATVVLDGCVEWSHSLAAMKQAPNFHALGIGDDGGYVEPRIVGMRVGTECFSILTTIVTGTAPDEATAAKVTRAVATKLASQLTGH